MKTDVGQADATLHLLLEKRALIEASMTPARVAALTTVLGSLIRPGCYGKIQVTARVKSARRLLEKILKNPEKVDKYLFRREPVTDLLGTRVSCGLATDIDAAGDFAARTLTVDWALSKSKHEFIRGDDRFGYSANHFIIQFPSWMSDDEPRLPKVLVEEPVTELQLMSSLHEAWADVQHDRGYKFDRNSEYRRRLHAVAAVIEVLDGEISAIARADLDGKAKQFEQQVRDTIKEDGDVREVLTEGLRVLGRTFPELNVRSAEEYLVEQGAELLRDSGLVAPGRVKTLLAATCREWGQAVGPRARGWALLLERSERAVVPQWDEALMLAGEALVAAAPELGPGLLPEACRSVRGGCPRRIPIRGEGSEPPVPAPAAAVWEALSEKYKIEKD